MVAPMTTGAQQAPFRVPVRFGGKSGLILLDQIRALDKQRFVKRLGRIDHRTLATALATIRVIFED